MKKKFVLILILNLMIFLGACGDRSSTISNSDNETTISQQELTSISDQTNENDLSNSEVQPNTTTTDFQMPEEGYYSNDYDEILKIKKEDDGTYNIEYSITHLFYVENAVGIYDSETGILSFSGKDDSGNDIKADIENKGDYLEVTVTQSNYKDIVGMTQNFSPADESQ